ncbi:cytochrome c oxidase subunit III [Natrinema pellirubrum DSM 15624]|uniref:Cytochrome c oxidase subunit III n=1 Tax=Natrinema pellirubrum (strain DSM 15624 / CIP 106293 / JCM 10476 / NCIMB 786 / 157) TaxID=797303 RepID=L0JMK4_NATP1|nr:heme-copper oxidase subunit III [Natrinema pellirubrum]AGB32073.1 heme/copper-type cytochrome/quinol oxidase, subunit 3 [Natrinema pellirubrum DSM 15624]ELY78061.1 cytochrome c oxidase subunit III [Natrinema pellirubrum DSM 15624]
MGTGDGSDRTPPPRADGSGHHVPEGQAPEEYGDHRGRGDGDDHEHRSRWPLIAAAGAAGLYAGVAIAVLGTETGLVPPLVGVALAVVGAAVLLAGIGGWLREAFLLPARDAGSPESRESYVSTTLLFLATDVSTFGALFVYYAFVRVGAWPPAELPPLVGSLVAANTAILLASSVTFHYAHAALEAGNRRRFLGFLGTTLALGIVFLAGQAYEYYEFVAVEGFSLDSGAFGTAFYGLTGLHGFHVALGVGAIAVLCWRALRGHYGPDRDTSIATVSLYWHFVDLVWLVLVTVLYVGASV